MTNALDREAVPEPHNPLGIRRHRIHRIRHVEAPGAGRRARKDGVPADRAPPLPRGRALPPGRDEHHRQRAGGGCAAHRAARPSGRSSARSPSASATPTRRFAGRSSSAPGRFPCGRGRWSSTFRPFTASARASSTSSTGTTNSRSTTSISAPFPRSTSIRPRSAACTSSASSSTSAPIAPRTGSSSTRRSSASRRCPTACVSASCPRGCCSRARAAASICS